ACPSRRLTLCFTSARIPAIAGVDADVPPTRPNENCPCPFGTHDPRTQIAYGSREPDAVNDTSGRLRNCVTGSPGTPVCHAGFAKNLLRPPPAAMMPDPLFHTFSGIGEIADPYVAPFDEDQYWLGTPCSLNCVPPTAMLYGLDARMLTESGP